MKISYILQLKDFSIMFVLGVIFGAIYGILNIMQTIKKSRIMKIILDFIFTLCVSCVFLIATNKINMGEFRIFLLAGYLLGILIERITFGKLFAKGYIYVYNKLIKVLKKFKESRIGRFLLK